MRPWRRNLILGIADHPLRALLWSVGIWAFGGLFFAVMMSVGTDFSRGVNIPAGREWQQPIADALGPAGFLFALSLAVFAAIGVMFSPLIYLTSYLSAKQIRAKEAAAAATPAAG
ncbi:MAG TPA: hypothetical protein VFS20_04165 [Longimicrobium sp.]|nr:hypothetical protein [Longimicrobium sp.]